MSDAPYGGHPPAPAPWPPQAPPPAGRQSRWPLLLTAAIALVAIGVAIASWFRPAVAVEATPDSRQYSEQEVADAKKAVCEAYENAYTAIEAAGQKSANDDPAWSLAVAVNTRLAFQAVADVMDSNLENYPAAPQELADQIGKTGSAYRDVVIALIANSPAEKLGPIYERMDAAHARVGEICS